MVDWKNIDYTAVLADRSAHLAGLTKSDEALAAAKLHYKHHPADFINDWGMTYDPRLLEQGRQANLPFILWPKQREYIEWLYNRWRSGERGLVEKSRDCGGTWLSVGFAVALWCFHDGVAIGFGSRKEALVDKLGDPDSIFEKIRHFVSQVPAPLLPAGYDSDKHSTFMRLISPTTGASITGEAGDNIGRGGRKSIFFIDEAAFIEHQALVDAALSQTTNCQIDISTFNGAGNEFYQKWQRFRGTDRHFVFDWRDDPRKDQAWYERQKAELSEATVAQEIDRDPLASNDDSFIPAKWLKATIDAHLTLQFEPLGVRVAAFDPADTGDAKAVVYRHGSVIHAAEELKQGDITLALPWAFGFADRHQVSAFVYDADGMGAPVIKTYLMTANPGNLTIAAYRGSDGVEDANKPYGGDRTLARKNGDVFRNYRAQTWTWFRDRCEKTYNAVNAAQAGGLVKADPDELISISSAVSSNLIAELSMPKRKFTDNGQIRVESKKEMKARGIQSPNLGDAAIMAMSYKKPPERVSLDEYIPHTVSDAGVGY